MKKISQIIVVIMSLALIGLCVFSAYGGFSNKETVIKSDIYTMPARIILRYIDGTKHVVEVGTLDVKKVEVIVTDWQGNFPYTKSCSIVLPNGTDDMNKGIISNAWRISNRIDDALQNIDRVYADPNLTVAGIYPRFTTSVSGLSTHQDCYNTDNELLTTWDLEIIFNASIGERFELSGDHVKLLYSVGYDKRDSDQMATVLLPKGLFDRIMDAAIQGQVYDLTTSSDIWTLPDQAHVANYSYFDYVDTEDESNSFSDLEETKEWVMGMTPLLQRVWGGQVAFGGETEIPYTWSYTKTNTTQHIETEFLHRRKLITEVDYDRYVFEGKLKSGFVIFVQP